MCIYPVSKIRKNIYRSDVLLYFWDLRQFQMSTNPLFQIKLHLTKYCLTKWISKLPGSFEIHRVRQYLVNFTGPAGIVNATVYKTKPIFTGLGHGKLSKFLTLFIFMKISVKSKKTKPAADALLLASPEHQQPWYWLYEMEMALLCQCSRKSLDMSDISDGNVQMSDERFHNFE